MDIYIYIFIYIYLNVLVPLSVTCAGRLSIHLASSGMIIISQQVASCLLVDILSAC